MSTLMAIDVAILPPAAVAERAMALSRSLPEEESKGLRLGPDALPHVTLTQQFVRREELDLVMERIDEVLQGQPPLQLSVPRADGGGGDSVSLAVELTPAVSELHERLMEALRGVERSEGGPGAFLNEDARLADVLWVAGYRLKSAFGAYAPHITLGHAQQAPQVEPFAFQADTVALCHLGRFCTCGQVLRRWTLS